MKKRANIKESATADLPDLSKWWEYPKEQILGTVYWLQNQIPPQDPKKRAEAWEKLKAKLQKKHPAPTQDRSDIDSGNDETAFDDYRNIE